MKQNKSSIQLTWIQRLVSTLFYSLSTILMTGVVSIASFAIFFKYSNNGLNELWANTIEPFLTLATFIIAFVFSVNGLYSSWVSSLPQRLDFHFVYYHSEDFGKRYAADKQSIAETAEEYIAMVNALGFAVDKGVILFSCYEATLASETDIRAWGQQIMKQMNEGKDGYFYPYISNLTPAIKRIKHEDGTAEVFRLHTLIMYATMVPNYTLKNKSYLVWEENYDRSPYNASHTYERFMSFDILNGNLKLKEI